MRNSMSIPKCLLTSPFKCSRHSVKCNKLIGYFIYQLRITGFLELEMTLFTGFPGAQRIKHLSAMQGDAVRSLGREHTLEKE